MLASLTLVVAAVLGNAPASFEWSYSPAGKRDPFRPGVSQPERGKCVRGSCLFPVSDLVLVGTATDVASPMAMLRDPQGVGYVVRKGSRVGKERFTVVAIRSARIELMRRVRVGDRTVEERLEKEMPLAALQAPTDLSLPEEEP